MRGGIVVSAFSWTVADERIEDRWNDHEVFYEANFPGNLFYKPGVMAFYTRFCISGYSELCANESFDIYVDKFRPYHSIHQLPPKLCPRTDNAHRRELLQAPGRASHQRSVISHPSGSRQQRNQEGTSGLGLWPWSTNGTGGWYARHTWPLRMNCFW